MCSEDRACVLHFGIQAKTQMSKRESPGSGNWLDLRNEAAGDVTKDSSQDNVNAHRDIVKALINAQTFLTSRVP